MVVENDVGHSLNFSMPRDSHRRKRRLVIQKSVHRDETLDATVAQHVRISFQQALIVTMGYGKKEKIVLPEVMLNAAHHDRSVGITNFFQDDANRVSAVGAQRTRQIIRTVVE